MKISSETPVNRPSCVDQERTSLSKRLVFIVRQLNGLDALNINDYLYLYRYTVNSKDLFQPQSAVLALTLLGLIRLFVELFCVTWTKTAPPNFVSADLDHSGFRFSTSVHYGPIMAPNNGAVLVQTSRAISDLPTNWPHV